MKFRNLCLHIVIFSLNKNEMENILESRYYIIANEDYLYKACDISILILTDHVTLGRSFNSCKPVFGNIYNHCEVYHNLF